jgi:CHAT domain-containing protein
VAAHGVVTRASELPAFLPPGQAGIEYWLGTTHAYAWVLKGESLDWIELPASSSIERAARDLHDRMRTSTTSSARRDACAELYRLALAPLGPALRGVRELTFIPDGSLHYAPFPALLDPARTDHPYVVQSFTVSVAPALRFLGARPGAAAAAAVGTRMLLVADPIYTAGDPRLGAGGEGAAVLVASNAHRDVLRGAYNGLDLVRLESSSREAAQIRDLLGAQNVDLLEGGDATREAVLARDLSRYRFIHIASHGLIDSEIPQLSALVLGTHDQHGPISDPYLRAADLLTRTFHAQAIVLSACDTALGKEYRSEGLVGLRYAALARGAHAVVASLWPVSDGVAATLMANMYQGLTGMHASGLSRGRSDGLQVARALADAMREALERSPSLDPALWAPFMVYVAGD